MRMATSGQDAAKKTRRDEVSPEFPSEILTEILVCLPAKSVGRFRTVSKQFGSMSSGSDFAKRHFDLAVEKGLVRTKLMCSPSRDSLFAVDLDDGEGSKYLVAAEFGYSNCDIIGSSNGLVCIAVNRNKDKEIFFCNPTTQESKRIPDFPESQCPKRQLLYHDELGGFGFDSVTSDYKLLRFVPSNVFHVTASIYSLKADSWRHLRKEFHEHYYNGTYGAYLNNALHKVVDDGKKPVLVAFDLTTEEFKEMPLPSELKDYSGWWLMVGILKGRLCVVYTGGSMVELLEDDMGKNVIWVMNEYGVESSWSKIQLTISSWRDMKSLCSAKNDDEIILLVDDRLVVCNIKLYTWRNMVISGPFRRSYKLVKATTYVESLVSPKMYEV